MVTDIKTQVETAWTIADQLAARNSIRDSWDRNFKANYSTLADEISESITKEIFGRLKETLSDTYKPLPLYSTPLTLTFPFEVWKHSQAAQMKTWAPKTAAGLAPFKEWLDTFSIDQNSIDSQPYKMKFSKFVQNNDLVETSYFQNKMNEVGIAVAKKIQETLSQFAQKPQMQI